MQISDGNNITELYQVKLAENKANSTKSTIKDGRQKQINMFLSGGLDQYNFNFLIHLFLHFWPKTHFEKKVFITVQHIDWLAIKQHQAIL